MSILLKFRDASRLPAHIQYYSELFDYLNFVPENVQSYQKRFFYYGFSQIFLINHQKLLKIAKNTKIYQKMLIHKLLREF